MTVSPLTRRDFIARSAALVSVVSTLKPATADHALSLSTNQYSWQVFYQRDGRNLSDEIDQALNDVASSGLQGFEANASSPEEIERLEPLLKKHRLEMKSLYVNSVLHKKDQAPSSIRQVMEIAKRARNLGTRIIVTNPSPIRWGGDEAKTDEQLIFQAGALSELALRLSDIGMTLAYHNHDAEMKHAAREFHHMMTGTVPEVTLCLDSHWVYRGAGNSQVALFDIVHLYGKKITELHLRQSHQGIWAETLTDGDLDYKRLAERLKDLNIQPHWVLEVAVEPGTPHTMTPVEAHRSSAEYARGVFARL